MKKLHTLLLMLSLLMSSVAVALAYEEAPREEPAKVIQSAIIKLNQLTGMATYSPQMMRFLVEQEITPLFDFEYIVNEVSAGSVNLNKEEFKYFSSLLKKNIINTLLERLAQGHSKSFNFISARPAMGGDIIIVRLNAKGFFRFGFNLDLSFHQNQANKWQVFDVALNYDSLINYYQRMVRSKVRRYGVYGMLGRI